MTEELKDYIEEQKQKGFSDEQIRQALLDAGWSQKDINKRFGKAKGGGKKGLIIGIIVIIVLIIAILLVVFNIGGIEDLFKKSEEIEIQTTLKEEESITWNTYQDDKYGFEAKYPSSVFYLDRDQRAMGDYEGVERRLDLKVDDNSYISVYIWQKDSAKDSEYDFETPDYEEINIDQEKGFRGEKKYQGVYFIETYIYKDAYIYQIEYTGSESQKNKTLYNQIVSAFKFLE